MSIKELAYSLIDRLSDSQLNAVVGLSMPKYNEAEPDEIDLQMIAEADADESVGEPIEDFAKRLGIGVNICRTLYT